MSMTDLLTVVNSDPMVPLNELLKTYLENGEYGLSALKELIDAINSSSSSGGSSVIKSIQRGTVSLVARTEVNTTINDVDLNKTILIITSLFGQSGDVRYTTYVNCNLTSNNNICFLMSTGHDWLANQGKTNVDWEVIEFY